MRLLVPKIRHPLALAVSLALAAGSAQAATVTVTSNLDDGSGCTLREAIVSMSSQALQAGCANTGAAFGTDDTIVFDASLAGANVSLSTGALEVHSDSAPLTLTIQGSGQTIDANHASRVLSVESATLTLSNLTLTGGSANYGGGIYAGYSTVTLNDCTVSGNTASSTTIGLGGGVLAVSKPSATLADSSITLSHSTVSDNTAYGTSAGLGGGLFLLGENSVTLTDSTVSDNTTYGHSAGLGAACTWPQRTRPPP